MENDWRESVGPLPYKLTNDYLFRALMQENEKARKSIIAAVLGLDYEEIVTAIVTNPIELGKSIDAKTFFLDVKVEINNFALINLEMQVINEQNWPERSLGYLCRTYDNLNAGSDYLEVKPAYQVGFLNFNLFKENDSFLSIYKLTNQENTDEIYTDKFSISVINLLRTENATERDVSSGLRDWARMFTAESWEEMKMIASDNEILSSAANSIHVMTQDEIIREQCRLREARTRAEEIKKQRMEALENELAEKERTISEKDKALSEKDKALSEQGRKIVEMDRANAELSARIAELEEKLKMTDE